MTEEQTPEPKITVLLDGNPIEVFAWQHVMDLLRSLSADQREAIAIGTACLKDSHGNKVGLEGGLTEGASFTYTVSEPEPIRLPN